MKDLSSFAKALLDDDSSRKDLEQELEDAWDGRFWKRNGELFKVMYIDNFNSNFQFSLLIFMCAIHMFAAKIYNMACNVRKGGMSPWGFKIFWTL